MSHTSPDPTLYGGIEAGGTKFVCVVAAGPDDVRGEERVPTTTPEETIGRAVTFFRSGPPVAALGVASFGPVDLRPGSASYGFITTTPKPGWANTNLVGALRAALGVPVGFDTDVNGAALAEQRWGAGQGADPVVYLTIGTGIGGGIVSGGGTVHGLVHPEIGHTLIPHERQADPFPGVCPYHGDCLEGLASGPALRARWGQAAETLPEDHPAWALEAHYLALAAANLVCTLSPERIIFGGGVMQQPLLLPLVRQQTAELLAGYVQSPVILGGMSDYIVAPGLGNRSGASGAIALAQSVEIHGQE